MDAFDLSEEDVLVELENIADGEPLGSGDTLSHITANECVRRGWASRDKRGYLFITDLGQEALMEGSR